MSNRFIPDRATDGSTTPSGGEREFSPGENIVVGGLSFWMGLVGMFTLIGGTLQAVLALLTLKTIGQGLSLGQGVLMMVVGGLLWGASRSFKAIVQTNNNDIGHLMSALGKLRTAYTIQGVVLIVVAALIAIALFMSLGGSHSS